MSDSFAELWNSTGAAKPVEPPRKLGTLSALSTGQSTTSVRKPDVFSMLASPHPSSSLPPSRIITPTHTGTPPVGTPRPVHKSVSSSGADAFSHLLSGTFPSGTSNISNMTIAERAAKVEQDRREHLLRHPAAAQQHATASAWAGLDALAGSSALGAKPAAPSSTADDHWAFALGPSKPAHSSPALSVTVAEDDDWGLGDFASQPAVQPPPKQASPAPPSIWDLHETMQARADSAPGRSGTPGDFDFGDREDGLLDDDSNDEDDILGALSRPVDKVSSRPTRPSPAPQPPRSRAVSPPPHIVGQIVEMGFSPQQARVALAATDTGLDVQAALETLLANGSGSSSLEPPHEAPPRATGYDASDDEDYPAPTSRRRTVASATSARGAPSEQGAPRRVREPAVRDGAPMSNEAQKLQEQADKLLAQASEIGLSMFNKANAFWREGKEKVQRAYEERAAAAAVAGPPRQSGAVPNGRPRWMQEAAEFGGLDEEEGEETQEIPVSSNPPRPRAAEPRPPPAEPVSAKVKTANLLSDDAPAVYVSPFRRKTPSRAATKPESAASSSNPPPRRASSPAPLTKRKTVTASPSAISTSAKHKAAGTDMFKLGRYAEAESSYSSAIAALPPNHLLLIPLHTNRALTRIKTGDHTGAVDDCTVAIGLVGPSYHPAREAKVTRDEEGAGVDLGDALVKALRRRAEAYEGREKWDAARQDWETLAGVEWAGKVRAEAIRGAGRCRRMLVADTEGGSASTSAPAPTAPKPKPKPTSRPAIRRGPTPPSEALNRVREANTAAEAEDQLRYELKDTVDARLTAWKGGKETNIRALIASLDTVLWPELGWQKVGMHELVTPSQVKIRYTKAIAKLHPDKLNAHNTTLEQRMIANGVFGALNEAWNAFKP